MQKRSLWQYAKFLLLAVFFASAGLAGTAYAVTSSSSNYQVSETQFGAGSTLQSCSNQYCAKASIGSATAGSGKSATTTASFGAVTSGEPSLDVVINQGVSNLGELSTETTASKTMTVQIRSYLSNGYTLQIVGTAPSYGGHTLDTPTTPTASQPGTEQFAINATKNTVPNIGADPVQVPSGDAVFGTVTSGYNTPNLFKYISGDDVVSSSSKSGQTNYTISMIVNISNSTPAGHYSGDFSAVVTPVY